MKIYAEGKFINSFPLSFFLTQGEQNADVIEFVVPRFYEAVDLAECTFVLTAVNAAGTQLESVLTKETNSETLTLTWNINGYFTAVAGLLDLGMRAVRSDASHAAGEYDETAVVLKYALSPVFVREAISGTEGLPTPDLIAQSLDQLAILLEDALDKIAAEATALGLTALSERIDILEDRTATEAHIIALTQAEYDALETVDDTCLYVILSEEEAEE